MLLSETKMQGGGGEGEEEGGLLADLIKLVPPPFH